MEPQIRYVQSADGTRIAVSMMGQGRPVVLLPTGWMTSMEAYWQVPETRANIERLAERRRVVQYDHRGNGLSERQVTDFSLQARMGDLTAVVDSLRLALAVEAMVRMMEGFLDEPIDQSKREELPSGTAVILFADIADSIGLTERLGDAVFRDKARELDAALRAAIRENGGTPVEGKLLGDGVLAVFTSARQAIEAGLACAQAGNHGGLPLHLGMHAGDVIREEGNVYGGAVNVASRIAGASAPGEVLVSETVRSLARTSAGVRFEDRGECDLKGVSEPVRVWAVREAGPSTSSGRAEG